MSSNDFYRNEGGNTPPSKPPTQNRPTNNSSHKKKRKLKKGSKVLLAMLIVFAICFGMGLGYVAWVLRDLPNWDAEYLAGDRTTFLYDNEGKLFTELHSTENRTPVTLDKMPTYLVDCLIGTEDLRFYKHGGVDVKRVFGALLVDLKSGSMAQGASTITMQLARNAILEDQDKKLARKIKESVIAIQLEREYSKDEILNMYLNEVYFGHGAYGVQAASQYYFSKDVEDITLSESAILVGLLRNPKKYSPINHIDNSQKVRNTVLDNLAEYKPEYKEQVEASKAEKIVVNEGKITSNYNFPWFTDYVISEAEDILASINMESASVYTGGFRIYTTVNSTVQTLMDESFADSGNFPSSRSANKVESAMAVMDVTNGAILGLEGGREHVAKRGLNRATDMERQPGSAYKPIGVFSPAIEAGYSPATVANDAPTTFGADYKPGNYDGSYSGVVSMREAARKSMNIPAVKYLQMVGTKASIKMAENLGIKLDEERDANLSMALGGLTYGISPLQMAAAYSAFANAGVYTEPRSIEKIVDATGKVLYEATPVQHEAMRDTTAYLVTSMLQTVTQSGTGTTAKLKRPVASKTGTVQLPDTPAFKDKKGNKDAWFAAYTPEMVGVVWMGYDSDIDDNGEPQYLRQIYGGKYPAQIWKEVVGGATKDLPIQEFARPDGIVSASVDSKTGLKPSSSTPDQFIKSELFDKDHVPKEVSNAWKTVLICPDSNKLATDFCPNPETTSRFTPPAEKNKVTGSGGDKKWLMPTTKCPIHISQGAGTISVQLCTDPAHQGKLVLANIATGNNTGGCPGKYVSKKYISPADVPTIYCEIANHQVIAGDGEVVTPTPPPANGGGTNKPKPPANGGSGSVSTGISTPSGLSGSYIGNDAPFIKLTWSDKNKNAVMYEVEYWDDVNSSKRTVTTYFKDVTISSLTSGTKYHFRIRAIDDNDSTNASGWSGSVSVTTK